MSPSPASCNRLCAGWTGARGTQRPSLDSLRKPGYEWMTVRLGERQAPPRCAADRTLVTRCGLVAKA